ncbi:uncharacterized protein [Clytia hemisphaerica]|uniref:Ubiquitin-like protease family profile domain-containing protein n=2 Tax=Clytia hemisphaerica TaxID=252671 RepID=A0A7M5XFK6_9CNID
MSNLMNEDRPFLSPNYKKKFQELFSNEQLIGLYSSAKHWRLMVIYPKQREVLLVDPFGETRSTLRQTKQLWEASMTRHFEGVQTWQINSTQHPKQTDMISCGAFCLKFAECILKGEDLPANISSCDMNDFRREIAINLIQIGGDGDWCRNICRLCDRTSPPPSKRAGTNPKEWGWVCCDKCEPEMWYHGVCLGIRRSTEHLKNVSFYCNKPVVQDEILALEVGETLIRQRKNRKISKCYGCSVPIKNAPLEAPYDMVLVQKMLGPRKGGKITDDPSTFVNYVCNYHPDRKCTTKINIVNDKIKISKDFKTIEVSHQEKLEDLGIDISVLN